MLPAVVFVLVAYEQSSDIMVAWRWLVSGNLFGALHSFELPLSVPDELESLACEEISDLGTLALNQGHLQRAAQAFTLGVHRCSQSTMFNNQAVALAMLASEAQGRSSPNQLLCEARAAADIAAVQGHADAGELREAIESTLDESGYGCSVGDVRQELSRKMLMQRNGTHRHLEDVAAFCAQPSFATLRPTTLELERGQFTTTHLRTILALFHVCGVIALEGLVPVKLLAEMHQAQLLYADEVEASQEGRLEVQGRGKHRRELRLPLRSPFVDANLTQKRLLLPLVRLLVGQKAELDTFSAIESMPGSYDQDWHVDAPTPSGRDDNPGSPAVGLVAVVPLVDVSGENGATSFLAGSHVDMGDEWFWIGPEDGDGASHVSPRLTFSLQRGAVVLFDLRLRHRGGSNKAVAPRSILYMSFVQDWFYDATNFKAKQTRAWDEFTDTSKKMFSRLDSRAYVQKLELELKSRGVDVHALASAGKYSPGRLEL